MTPLLPLFRNYPPLLHFSFLLYLSIYFNYITEMEESKLQNNMQNTKLQ